MTANCAVEDRLMKALRILVVDDEAGIRDVVKRRLARDGHHVEEAADGVAALAAFEQAGFDCVITDLHMPGMGGVELVKRIKERAPQTVTLILTGFGTLDAAMEAMRQGCDDFLVKPLDNLEIITHAIERSLSRQNALVMAASARKLSEAKDNILDVVIEEMEARLNQLGEHVNPLEQAAAAAQSPEIMKMSGAVQAQLAQLRGVLADARAVHKTVCERIGE
jgi:DNA-binding NtrC family response regulator